MAKTKTMGTTMEVDAKSLRETTQALRMLEPDVLKSMGRELRKVAASLRSAAQARYSQEFSGSGAYSAKVNLGKRKVGVKVMARGGAKGGKNDWSTPGVKAAIMEFYGSKSSGKTPQAQGTIAWLNAKYGSPGRILYREWDARKAEFQMQAAAAVHDAEAAANLRLGGRR